MSLTVGISLYTIIELCVNMIGLHVEGPILYFSGTESVTCVQYFKATLYGQWHAPLRQILHLAIKLAML